MRGLIYLMRSEFRRFRDDVILDKRSVEGFINALIFIPTSIMMLGLFMMIAGIFSMLFQAGFSIGSFLYDGNFRIVSAADIIILLSLINIDFPDLNIYALLSNISPQFLILPFGLGLDIIGILLFIIPFYTVKTIGKYRMKKEQQPDD